MTGPRVKARGLGWRLLAAAAICSVASWTMVARAEATPTAAQFSAAASISDGSCEHSAGRVLVRFRPGVTDRGRADAFAALGARVLHAYRLVSGLEVLSTSMPIGRATAWLKSQQVVQYAQPDCVVHVEQAPPNDGSFGQQWSLANTGQGGGTAGADIRALGAWDVRTDASSVLVGVIDTGIQVNHPDLAANVWVNPGEIANNGIDDDHDGYVDDVNGWNFVSNNNDPTDDNGHGTHVSGIVGAVGNNGIGVTGVAWKVKLMALKAFDANGMSYTSTIVEALDYAVMKGARITNNSFGVNGFEPALYDAFAAAGAAGDLAVAAAGNDGVNADEQPHYPAAFRLPSVISVAASTNTDTLAPFSDYGIYNVQVAAPGVSIYSTYPGSSYATLSGTSMAAPHVTGVAALLAAEHPTWVANDLRDRILGTTRSVAALSGFTWTGGVVDAESALGNGPTELPPPPPPPAPEALATTAVPDPAPPPASAPSPPTFPVPQELESSPADLGPPRIALDGAGNPYIAFTRRYQGAHLMSLQSGTWVDEQLTSAYDDFYWMDLAVDGTGIPTVALQRQWSQLDNYSDPGIMLVRAENGGPTTSRLTASCREADSCFEDWNPSLAFDASGAAHVAFNRTTPSPYTNDRVVAPAGSASAVPGVGLYYATNASGSWAVRQVTTNANDGTADIAVAADGTAHFVFNRRDGSKSGLYYATDAGGSWSILRLTDNVEDRTASIGVDSQGGVHVAFVRTGLGVFYLHRSPAGVWDPEVEIYTGAAAEPELAVDGAGKVHAAFTIVDATFTVAGVKYATNRTGTWVVTSIAGGEAHQPSLAVDPSGHAFIAFSQAVGNPLGVFYATNVSGSFQTSLVRASSSEGGLGDVAYALDSGGFGHVAIAAHYGEADSGLYYGTNRSGAWVFTRVYPGWQQAVALAVDASGHAYITFAQLTAQSTPDSVRYATDTSGSWQVTRVTPDANFSADGLAIALDNQNSPEILFADSTETRLRRAQLAAGIWQIGDIYSGPSGIRQPSMLIDSSNAVHVALTAQFSGETGFRVVYLRGDGGTWTSSSVTSGAYLDFYPSIGRTSDGTVWIADWRLDHGVWISNSTGPGTWSSAPLSANQFDGPASLAVDGSDVVHVAYARGSFYGASGCTVPECAEGPGLRQAVFSDGTWQTTKLSPYWHDTNPLLAAGSDGSVGVVFSRTDIGLRALSIVQGQPENTLTVTETGTGLGTVSSNPSAIYCGFTCSASFVAGASVTLTAMPKAGSTFTGWSGGTCSGTGTCNVTLSADAAVTATFAKTTSAYRPDGRIKVGKTALVGNGTYNSDGTNQTVQGAKTRGHVVTFTISIQNDANAVDAFTVVPSGAASTMYRVTYIHGSTNITASISAGTFHTPVLASGSSYAIVVKVKVLSNATVGSSVSRLVTVTSLNDGSVLDAVRFTARRQ